MHLYPGDQVHPQRGKNRAGYQPRALKIVTHASSIGWGGYLSGQTAFRIWPAVAREAHKLAGALGSMADFQPLPGQGMGPSSECLCGSGAIS